MLSNIKEYYKPFQETTSSIDQLIILLDSGKVIHSHVVVIFFFFLSIDSKMRHWLLCVHQSATENKIRDELIKKNITMTPNGTYDTSQHYYNPFLGQNIAFSPLHPHQAVPILLEISKESFFNAMFVFGTSSALDDTYQRIKKIVIVS
jgi:hypothetical protein